ncbi:MAG: hypothetical protein AB1633_01925 [Elusimicrobiota bacterium]
MVSQESNVPQVSQSYTLLPGLRGAPLDLPDISILGDFYGKISKDNPPDDGFFVREIELALQGYIYPEMRADIFLAMHRHEDVLEPELCEGYVSFLKLLGGLSMKMGKIHVDFGKINRVHQHARPYVDQPTVITNFLGDHGLVGEGLSLSYLLPLPVFLEFDVGAWRIPAHTHKPEETKLQTPLVDSDGNNIDEILVPGECGDEFGLAENVWTGRIWASFATGDTSELEFGLNGAKGMGSHYLHHLDRAEVTGADGTFRFWISSFKRLILQTEILNLTRTVPPGILSRQGFYSYFGYQFSKYWEAGLRYDNTDNAFPVNVRTNLISVVITNKLTETTMLRLQYGYEPDTNKSVAYFQTVFGIGPHSHPLQ